MIQRGYKDKENEVKGFRIWDIFGKTYRLRKAFSVLYTEKNDGMEELHKKIRK